MVMSPPTGEREGALALILGFADRWAEGSPRDREAFEKAEPIVRAILLAAPAQPGEGEPSADEWAEALRPFAALGAEVEASGLVDVPASRPIYGFREANITFGDVRRARALLERRGGPPSFGEQMKKTQRALRAAFDRDACGGLIVRGIPGSDGSDLTCQRCWPDMVLVKRCDHCFDPLPRFDFETDGKGDPFCRECARHLKYASARRSRP